MTRRSPDAPSKRRSAERLKRKRHRKASSTRWLTRQINDPYVKAAREAGYRSRAAFKLIALDERFGLFKAGQRVVDLGAAPGGWSQVAAERVGSRGRVVAVDITPLDPIADVTALAADALDDASLDAIRDALGGPADVVLSDMAAPATGHAGTDHLRVVMLCEAAFDMATVLLAPDGSFVGKVRQGGAEGALLQRLRRAFRRVRHAKPPASRTDSPESYVVATGFRGAPPAAR